MELFLDLLLPRSRFGALTGANFLGNQEPQIMRSTYETKSLSKGNISVRTTEVDYTLPRIMETQRVWDEESERWRIVRVERRPDLHITTKVVCSKNRFGHVRLYGPQGVN